MENVVLTRDRHTHEEVLNRGALILELTYNRCTIFVFNVAYFNVWTPNIQNKHHDF